MQPGDQFGNPPTPTPSYLPPSNPQSPFAQPGWAPNVPPPPVYPTPSPAQMGTGQGLASIRRAFAGRGALIMHYSWLLGGKQVEAASVRTAILELLQQRKYAGLNVFPERLIERGL